jgi:hypothetical protein
MINSVKLISVTSVEEGMVLDLTEDEYAQDFEMMIDIDVPFEVVSIDYTDEEIIFVGEDGDSIQFPYAHEVYVADMYS